MPFHQFVERVNNDERGKRIVIVAPSLDASPEDLDRYLQDVRQGIGEFLKEDFLGETSVRYDLSDGTRGGYFANPWTAVQELLHEVTAHAGPASRERMRQEAAAEAAR